MPIYIDVSMTHIINVYLPETRMIAHNVGIIEHAVGELIPAVPILPIIIGARAFGAV